MSWEKKRKSEKALTERRKRKQQEAKTSNLRDWAGLLDYLLEGIIDRLPLADCLSFGGVCKPWRSISFTYLSKSDRVVPCLVKRGQNENKVSSRSCFSILGNKNFDIKLPEAYESCIMGSFNDWLFIGKLKKALLHISALNPFSGENIHLPVTMSANYLMVVSAIPSDEKCVFMLVACGGRLAFWTSRARSWCFIKLSAVCILDALYYDRCFYLLGRCNNIFVVNENNVISVLETGDGIGTRYACITTKSLSVKLPEMPISQCARHFLVESRGEILLVCRFFYRADARLAITAAFEIYRLDLCKMAWVKLDNLEDQILFVGPCCSRSFHGKDLGAVLSNSVYFVNEGSFLPRNEWIEAKFFKRYESDDLGCYSFQKPNHWPSVFEKRPRHFAGVWLTTTLGWCLKQSRC